MELHAVEPQLVHGAPTSSAADALTKTPTLSTPAGIAARIGAAAVGVDVALRARPEVHADRVGPGAAADGRVLGRGDAADLDEDPRHFFSMRFSAGYGAPSSDQ